MEEHLIPYLPQGLTVETFEFLPEVAQEAILTQARERYETEQNNNEYAGVERLMSSRIPIEDVHDYTDLAYLFEEFPAVTLLVQMPSGKNVTMTARTYNDLIDKYEGDYENQEGYDMANFRILSVIRYSEKSNQFLRGEREYIFRQPDLGGIDDVRFKIQEKYVPNDYFCPTNLNCVGKCILKYLELNNRNDLRFEIEDINFDTVVTIPDMNSTLKKAGSQIRVISYTNKDTVHYKDYVTVPIYKYEIKPGYFHAILILDVKKYRNKAPKIDIFYEFTDLEDLDQDALDMLRSYETLKEHKSSNFHIPTLKYAFDFETLKGESPIPKVEYKQQPYLLVWGNDKIVDYEFNIDEPKKTVNDKFLKFLKGKLTFMNKNRKPKDIRPRRIVMFSFNGAVFDNHLFLESLEHPEWKIKSGGYLGTEAIIKRFSIKNKTLKFENEVVFVDAKLFLPPGMSLEQACKTFGCTNLKYAKEDFNIANYMTKETILSNKEKIIKYALQDVRSTYELTIKFDKYAKQVSESDISMFNCVSIANYADKVRDFYHPENIEIYYNPRREITEFMRNSVNGGRLIVGKLKYDKPAVAADEVSLYPSGMKLYEYPVGKRRFLNRKCHPEIMEDYKNKLNSETEVKPSMMRVTFEINPKCLIPMLPVKGSDPKALVKTSDFTVVELQQAIKHGKYKILEVLFVVEFEQSAKIFEKFVDTFSEKRLGYKMQMVLEYNPNKSKDKQSDEYNKLNVLQDLCKLIMNSSYGSFLLKPFDVVYKFISKEKFERDYDGTMSLITIVNNQYFVSYKNKCHHDNRRPLYLGTFILSNSKVIFNNLIAALDGFFNLVIIYADTDSVYIPLDKWHLLEKAGLVGNNLGQCKNDFGEGVWIEKFRCLGKKMKICLLNDGDIKTTIKGFKGLKDLCGDCKKELMSDFDHVITTNSREAFKTVAYDTMQRSGLEVNVRHATRSFKMTAYDQYQVVNNECYPLYYDISKIPK